MKRRSVLGLPLLLLGLACGKDPAPAPTSAPIRLISLTPSATEVVAALGATSFLIGVDDYSAYPPEVTKLPKVGSFLSPNVEAIVRLRPTLVIVDDVHGGAAGALHDAGIATIECPMHALPDVRAALTALGDRLGRAEAARAAGAAIDSALDAARAHHVTPRPKVLVIIDREAGGLGNLIGAGPGSWVDELLAAVGGDNVLSSTGVRYPKMSLETVLRTQPEVILDLSYAGSDATAWQSVAVPAVANHRVVALSPVKQPFLAAPSPRVADALAALAAAIH